MSINRKTAQFLDHLYSKDTRTESIELEFMQISELNGFIDQLSMFKSLRRLSLHGNRIKQIPLDIGSLRTLEEIDVSNNMLKDAKSMIVALKGLPNLKRLICSFRKEDEEMIIQNLPKLEYYNNSKIEKNKKEVQTKRYNKHEIKSEDIQKAAKVYDQIRTIFRKNYNNNNDNQNKLDFEEDTQFTINNLQLQLKENSKAPENVLSALYLTCRYALFKTIETKMTNLVSDIDMEQGKVLSDVFDQYSVIVSNLAEVAMSGISVVVAETKNQKENKLQLLEKELRRLRRQKQETTAEMANLQAENKSYIDALVRLSKGQKIAVVSQYRSRDLNDSPKRSQLTDRVKTNLGSKEFVITSNGKSVTLKQLKDVIEQIQDSKVKFDQKVMDGKLPRQTMYEYLFTFLNQKYGLKTLTIEWASTIVSGIQRYSAQDNDVAVFGKILRNECEEEFRRVQLQGKATVMQLLKLHIKGKLPYKSQGQIREVLESKMGGYIGSDQAEDIVKYIYSHSDADQIVDKLKVLYSIQVRQGSRKSRDQNVSRDNQNSIKYSSFLKCILDHQLKNHQKYLKPLNLAFQNVDNDSDGVITEQQFSQLLHQMSQESSKQLPRFLQIVDPHQKGMITYSEVCRLFSNYPEGNPILSRFVEKSK